jgi:hypothetical protein
MRNKEPGYICDFCAQKRGILKESRRALLVQLRVRNISWSTWILISATKVLLQTSTWPRLQELHRQRGGPPRSRRPRPHPPQEVPPLVPQPRHAFPRLSHLPQLGAHPSRQRLQSLATHSQRLSSKKRTKRSRYGHSSNFSIPPLNPVISYSSRYRTRTRQSPPFPQRMRT